MGLTANVMPFKLTIFDGKNESSIENVTLDQYNVEISKLQWEDICFLDLSDENGLLISLNGSLVDGIGVNYEIEGSTASYFSKSESVTLEELTLIQLKALKGENWKALIKWEEVISQKKSEPSKYNISILWSVLAVFLLLVLINYLVKSFA